MLEQRRLWDALGASPPSAGIHRTQIDSLSSSSGPVARKLANYELSHVSTRLDPNLSSRLLGVHANSQAPAHSGCLMYNFGHKQGDTQRQAERIGPPSKRRTDLMKGQRAEHAHIRKAFKGLPSRWWSGKQQMRYIPIWHFVCSKDTIFRISIWLLGAESYSRL